MLDDIIKRAVEAMGAERPTHRPIPSSSIGTGDQSDIVSHYTDFNALRSILRERKIWLSETTYMNDRAELKMFRENCLASFKTMLYGSDMVPHPRNRMLLPAIPRLTDISAPIFNQPAYLASFSSEPSLLSQWRAYCPNGGVSIQFKQSALEKAAETHQFETCWCKYDGIQLKPYKRAEEDKVTQAWRQLWSDIVQLGVSEEAVSDHKNALSSEQRAIIALEFYGQGPGALEQRMKFEVNLRRLAEAWLRIAPRFKHYAFREESEFRIFTLNPPAQTIAVRNGRHGFVRYVELQCGQDPTDFIHSVTLGPCEPDHQDALLAAIRRVLEDANAGSIKVQASNIPLRM